ncbi:hypothetical protein GCM10022289_21050 [Pedobacter jeongneungensis]|uniref:Uncharacterized protein n=1 Tax=Pedobacter jeongneungensis TaxID=947309 RepID=A0ABP8BDW2_9SPHI
MENLTEQELEDVLFSIGPNYLGKYLMNKFFIQIKTTFRKKDIPSYDYEKHDFSHVDQLAIQKLYQEVIHHENIHYVHEVSTMVGITTFYFQVINRAIFTEFVNVPESSSVEKISGEKFDMWKGINGTLFTIMGGSAVNFDNRIVYNIQKIEHIDIKAYAPYYEDKMDMSVPMIHYEYLEKTTGQRLTDQVFFGHFYIYEGLASNLERECAGLLGKKNPPKSKLGFEYLLMEKVAKHIYPRIKSRDMLELASLSLSYLNAAQMFVQFVTELKAAKGKKKNFVEKKKNEVSYILSEKLDGVKQTLEEIAGIFDYRESFKKAVGHLTSVMLEGYKKRIENPVFEVDLTFAGEHYRMGEYVTLCDMAYELVDNDDYMKDYSGTYLAEDSLSHALRVLLCHVDYYSSFVKGEQNHRCPQYTFCSHERRKQKPDQCRTTPRLAFEDMDELGACHYSLGVAYCKATDIAQTGSQEKI